ncbi:MAG: DUF951 domain-containing protein [Ruminococcaceae bacterium]|nr:DUF951 domain-containing protein [Oscillospiraceae bacterium]
MEINIGDIIEMKKKHPCGSTTFTVKRTGMDIGIKCNLCGHYILVPRNKLIKNIKKQGV